MLREMNNRAGKGIRSIVGAGLFLSTLFSLIAFRFISLPVLAVMWVFLFKPGRYDLSLTLKAGVVWLLLTFSPIDVLPFPRRWPPRLVPVVMGLPRRETLERAKRGEVILGGCIVTGFEPKYYLVW